MSSRRSRNGGRWMVTVLMRKKRSSRNSPSRDLLLERAERGRDDADVHVDRALRAQPFDLPLLEDAEQLDLERERQLADLVEEERAAGRGLEATDVALGRTGERAALVAEQLGLEERLGQRRAAHANVRARPARRVVVDRRRDQLLAGAALPLHQNVGVRVGDHLDQLEHLLHLLALADDAAEREAPLELLLEADVLLLEEPERADVVQAQDQSCTIENGFEMKSAAPCRIASTAARPCRGP